MASNNSIDLVSLDFDTLKSDFKRYLSSQEKYKDFDFEGSNINVLLDILAYNTHKNAFYLNMGVSEAHIDSAQLLNSVRSQAKELNYTPRSAQSAKAKITCTFEATGDRQPYIIQKGQTFSSFIKNNSYVFSIPETITVSSPNTSFSFTTDIYEGIYVKDSYVYNSDDISPIPTYKITNKKVDTRSITVSVFEDDNVVGTNYKLAYSLLDLNSQSKVYFLQTSAIDGSFEILFGDGVIGRKPKNGSTIVIDYRITEGSLGNGSTVFSCNFDPTGGISELNTSVSVTTVMTSQNGTDEENIETTRFYAPRYFQTQERAIVASDYEILLKQKFPEINAATAYGGEELNPPQYGNIMIALDLRNIDGLPTSRVDEYYKFIKSRCSIPLTPYFIVADHTYIYVNTTVRYNVNITSESTQRIQTLVAAAISDYNNTFLNDFNIVFRKSQFTNLIDNADSSIVSNITTTKVYKKINPDLNVTLDITVNFGMPLVKTNAYLMETHNINKQKTISSSLFTFNDKFCQFEDNGDGIIRIVTKENSNFIKLMDVGYIDYDTGRITLSNFKISNYEGNCIKIYAEPVDDDISTSKNNIISIEPAEVNIIIEQIAE